MTLPSDDPQALAQSGADLLKRLHHMVIGTADSAGQPWVVPVSHTVSPEGAVTWRSRTDARHSRNLAAHANMSATLYEVEEHGEVSLFLEGNVTISNNPGDFRIYTFNITGVWMNDDTHIKYPVELELFRGSLSRI